MVLVVDVTTPCCTSLIFNKKKYINREKVRREIETHIWRILKWCIDQRERDRGIKFHQYRCLCVHTFATPNTDGSVSPSCPTRLPRPKYPYFYLPSTTSGGSVKYGGILWQETGKETASTFASDVFPGSGKKSHSQGYDGIGILNVASGYK